MTLFSLTPMGSANSNIVQVTVSGPTGLVLQPIVQNSFDDSGTEFNQNLLQWNDLGNVDTYEVQRQINGGGFSLWDSFQGPFTNPVNDDDTAGAADWIFGEYDYFVVAKDSGGGIIATSNTQSTTWVPPVGVTTRLLTAHSFEAPWNGTWETPLEGYTSAVAPQQPNLGSLTPNTALGVAPMSLGFITQDGQGIFSDGPFNLLAGPRGGSVDWFSSIDVTLDPTALTFQSAVGGTGALGSSGVGSGWCSGASNSAHPFGTLTSTPSPPLFFGKAVAAFAYTATGPHDNTLCLIVAGSLPQSSFDHVTIGAITLTSASASYSTSLLAGFTTWIWAAPSGNPFPGTFTVNLISATHNYAIDDAHFDFRDDAGNEGISTDWPAWFWPVIGNIDFADGVNTTVTFNP